MGAVGVSQLVSLESLEFLMTYYTNKSMFTKSPREEFSWG